MQTLGFGSSIKTNFLDDPRTIRVDPRTMRVPGYGFQVPNFEFLISGFESTRETSGLKCRAASALDAGFGFQVSGPV